MNMQNVFLSIVIPVYNVEKYVEKCILSCMNQDIPSSDYEVICVNDGSTDDSLKIVNRVAGLYSNVKVISQPNGGLSAARNTGIQMACGRYIMLVDSDDWIKDNCLSKLIQKLKLEIPDALIFSVGLVNNDKITIKQKFKNDITLTGKDVLKIKVSPCAQYTIWSSDFLNKNKLSFYKGILHEDSEFTPRAYYLAKKISLVSDIVYYAYTNPNSITHTVNPKRSFDLVQHVCMNLSAFSENVDNDCKIIFNNMISMYLNNSLANIIGSKSDVIKELNECIYNHRRLFVHLKDSSMMKYRIEYFLFSLFPKHYVWVYKMMKAIS